MKNIMHKIGKISSFLTKYIGVIIIAFSVLAFFWRDGFAWTTKYTSVFLGVAMVRNGASRSGWKIQGCIFKTKRSTDRICVAVYDHAADRLDPLYDFKTSDGLALGVILVGCCPGGTASNVITYIAGGRMWHFLLV